MISKYNRQSQDPNQQSMRKISNTLHERAYLRFFSENAITFEKKSLVHNYKIMIIGYPGYSGEKPRMPLQLVSNILSVHKQNLKELKIRCHTETTDKDLNIFGIKLGSDIKEIQKLCLNLTGCVIITNSALENIGQNILKHLTKLRQLNLNFTKCELITSKQVELMVSKIGRYLDLDQFNLKFKKCNVTPNKNFEAIVSKIGNYLPQLRQLGLDFSSCKKIRNEGLEKLGRQIANKLTRLQHLSLTFDGLC